jgi:hypothetical protein
VCCGGRHTVVTVMTEWKLDEDTDACMRCSSKFNFSKRKVRCVRCVRCVRWVLRLPCVCVCLVFARVLRMCL